MSVLLLGASYYGTLAAARAFGAAGIEVIMADDDLTAVGFYSRFVTERRRCPKLSDTARFLAWLVEQGRAAPQKLVLYPTNDHLAWLLAAHRKVLDPLFHCYQPSEDAIIGLLDKQRLRGLAAAVGLEMPQTLVPGPVLGLEQVARSMSFPLLLKPRTQIFLGSAIKGVMVTSPQELPALFGTFLKQLTYAPTFVGQYPEMRAPLVQEYLRSAETSILSVSGFRSREGELAVRSAMKVLQRPEKVGIGLCFEDRVEKPELVAKLAALCAKVDYFGTFEAEFIVSADRHLLIDFNPRFYSQMGFDHGRGLNHALLTYFGARGEVDEVSRLLAQARAWRSRGDEAYCHRALLELVLGVQGASGRMTAARIDGWRTWLAQRRDRLTDAVWSGDDPLPTVIDSARWIDHIARHPRSFFRSYVFNQ